MKKKSVAQNQRLSNHFSFDTSFFSADLLPARGALHGGVWRRGLPGQRVLVQVQLVLAYGGEVLGVRRHLLLLLLGNDHDVVAVGPVLLLLLLLNLLGVVVVSGWLCEKKMPDRLQLLIGKSIFTLYR